MKWRKSSRIMNKAHNSVLQQYPGTGSTLKVFSHVFSLAYLCRKIGSLLRAWGLQRTLNKVRCFEQSTGICSREICLSKMLQHKYNFCTFLWITSMLVLCIWNNKWTLQAKESYLATQAKMKLNEFSVAFHVTTIIIIAGRDGVFPLLNLSQ